LQQREFLLAELLGRVFGYVANASTAVTDSKPGHL